MKIQQTEIDRMIQRSRAKDEWIIVLSSIVLIGSILMVLVSMSGCASHNGDPYDNPVNKFFSAIDEANKERASRTIDCTTTNFGTISHTTCN